MVVKPLNQIYEEGKRALQDKNILNWCEAGAGTKTTIFENERALKDILVTFRTLHEKFEADISTTILGKKSNAPFCPSSVAGASRIIETGEVLIVEASSEFGVPVFLYDGVSGNIDKYTQISDVPIFLVLKPLKDIKRMESLISKATESNVSAIGVNVDVLYGLKSGDKHIDLKNIGPTQSNYYEKIREMTDLPMFLKGILHHKDAKLAFNLKYDAIVISNHGGRVMDYCCSPIRVLPKIKEEIGDKIEIYIDSGFRTALDIYKGLALGANAVLLGRPILYGLAAGGEKAVNEIYKNLSIELKRIMGLTNCRTISEITDDNIFVVKHGR